MKRVNFTIQTLALSLCMGIIISCNPTVSTTHAIPTPPTPKPTTVLTPLAEFQLGHCDKPEEEYLFLKISSNMACSPACNCPEIEPPQPAIKRDGEDIRYNFDQVIGSFEPWNPADPVIGLLIQGWFEDTLYVIDEIPFDLAGSRIRLLSCMAMGTAVIEIRGEAFILDPGQSWTSQSVRDEAEGCYQRHTLSLCNEGLIEKWHFRSNLSVSDEFVRLEMKKMYYSAQEEISFAIVVIGEENIDLSGWCSMIFEKRAEDTWVEVGDCSATPDDVPEPFPRQSGDIIEMRMPSSCLGLQYEYQYALCPGLYRIKIRHYRSGGYHELHSAEFRIIE